MFFRQRLAYLILGFGMIIGGSVLGAPQGNGLNTPILLYHHIRVVPATASADATMVALTQEI